MHILEDLYTGNVRPGERSFRQNSQYSRALTQAVESGDALSKSLTEEQKKLFVEKTLQRLIVGGTDVATVAGLLGHSQPSTPLAYVACRTQQ